MSRAIGENKQKVDPRFLKAIADARRAQEQAHMQQQAQAQGMGAAYENLLASDEVDNPEVMEQRRQAAEAFQRYHTLVKKLQNPKSKRDILDVLEYQQLRDKQADYSRVLMEAMQERAAAKEASKAQEASKA